MLADGLFHDVRTREIRVGIASFGMAQVGTENCWNFARILGRKFGIPAFHIRIVVLAGERVMSGNRIQRFKQRLCFGRSSGSYRPDLDVRAPE